MHITVEFAQPLIYIWQEVDSSHLTLTNKKKTIMTQSLRSFLLPSGHRMIRFGFSRQAKLISHLPVLKPNHVILWLRPQPLRISYQSCHSILLPFWFEPVLQFRFTADLLLLLRWICFSLCEFTTGVDCLMS